MADPAADMKRGAWTAIDDKFIGLGLAIAGSFMIGISSIITKKGLIDAASDLQRSSAADEDDLYDDPRAPPRSSGGASSGVLPAYLSNYIWWAGMVTMVIGEFANFAAYIFAPPILVAPLGGLSVIIAAILASFLLKENLGESGRVACTLCLLGSMVIVLHAPEDKEIATVDEILGLAMAPTFVLFVLVLLAISFILIYRVAPKHGLTNPVCYITICSIFGSLSVMAIKGLGVAINLTLKGNNQLDHLSFWVFALVSGACIAVQMNYFNKALDTFHTNIVNPIYYVMFSTATILASLILNKGFNTTDAVNTLSLLCGFITIFLGVYLLVTSRIQADVAAAVAQGYTNPNSPTTPFHHHPRPSMGGYMPTPVSARFGPGGPFGPRADRSHGRNNSGNSFLERGLMNPRISIDGAPNVYGQGPIALEGTAAAPGGTGTGIAARRSAPGTPRSASAQGGAFPFREHAHRKSSSIYRKGEGNTVPTETLFDFPGANGSRTSVDRDLSAGPTSAQPFSVGLDIDEEEEDADVVDERAPLSAAAGGGGRRLGRTTDSYGHPALDAAKQDSMDGGRWMR